MTIVALDVHYGDDGEGCAAAVWFPTWDTEEIDAERSISVEPSADYVPGSFYLRELPALLAVLAEDPWAPMADTTVVVDGYVHLGDKPGLGAHLQRALADRGTPPRAVVGVAKNRFRSADDVAITRGASTRPLFVTALGIDVDEAARAVVAMAGPHRIPTLLQRVDALSRGR